MINALPKNYTQYANCVASVTTGSKEAEEGKVEILFNRYGLREYEIREQLDQDTEVRAYAMDFNEDKTAFSYASFMNGFDLWFYSEFTFLEPIE